MKNLKFKQALEKLEEIVKELEEGDLCLEKMLQKYEEGVKLSNLCGKKLNEAKEKVKVLTEDKNGFKEEEFETDQ